MVFQNQLGKIKQSFQALDLSCLGHTILAAQDPDQLDQRYKRDEARSLGCEGFKQRIGLPALDQIVPRNVSKQNVGVESSHESQISPRRSTDLPNAWLSSRSSP